MHDPNSTPIKIAQRDFMIHGADSMIARSLPTSSLVHSPNLTCTCV